MSHHEADDSPPVGDKVPAPVTNNPSRPIQRQQAPSLDVIAAQTSGSAAVQLEMTQQDSRSSSSTNSPIPNDTEESDFFLATNDSQSSLGVPNLQDMQVNDEECTAPINRLPNEILIAIFAKLSSTADQLRGMLVCKRWARNTVDLLWHRPACSNWTRYQSICQTLGVESPYFAYRDFIKRLNLASIADKVNDGSVMPLAVCTRVERLTLTNCKGLTDTGLIALVQNSSHLLALDISGDDQITEAAIMAIADNCKRLQGLNISNCTRISSEGMIKLAQNCRFIKRLKLNECVQLADESVIAFAEHCPNILEVDLHQCRWVTNQPITDLLAKGQSLRELRLVNCDLVDDGAFLSLPSGRTYEHLRILDLTSCVRLTDRAVEKIIEVAPRLRNLVFAKCRNLTDAAVHAISKLGKNLHYVHLGHCLHITDEAVRRLVRECNRIRYIDLGCCQNLTDDSVMRLATLPKLKRIGLVKCSSITDESVFALARANQRLRQKRDAEGNPADGYFLHSSLERVHLSYCTNLTLKSIGILLNSCPRLTHLSLTGVQAFLRDDLSQFCRDAPPEFTQHQRDVFCVFSGQGVLNLRRYMNSDVFVMNPSVQPVAHRDAAFDDQEPDAIDDDDVLDDGSEMVIDTQPLLGDTNMAQTVAVANHNMIPPPPPPPLPPFSTIGAAAGHPISTFAALADDADNVGDARTPVSDEDEGGGDAMDVSPSRSLSALHSSAAIASGSQAHTTQQGPSLAANRHGSQQGMVGASTASLRTLQVQNESEGHYNEQ